jgi:membrane protein
VRVKQIAKQTWQEVRRNDVFGRAAQLAYYFFLALFPFLICIIAALSVFGSADRGRAVLFSFFAELLPAPAFQLISKTFAEIIQSSGPLKMSLGVIASIWSASLGVTAMMDTLNASYRVEESRPLWKQYLIAVSLTLGIGLVIVISTLSVIIGDQIARALVLPYEVTLAWRIGRWPLAVGLLLLAFAVVYYFAPDRKQPTWHWLSLGASLGVLLLLSASMGVRIYLHFAGSYTTTYGSLGGVIVLLLYFYLGGVAVLAGGALNGVMERIGKPSN